MVEPGDLVGIYKVLEEMPYRDKYGHRLFKVKCTVCGFENIMRSQDIKTPKSCTHVNYAGEIKNYKNHPIIKDDVLSSILKDMKTRCYNPNDRAYRWYGAKGIKICKEWLNNTSSFIEWALSSGYERGLTIDRIDSTKDYCPENCRWVTREDNAKHKSTTNYYTVNSETKTGKDWSKSLGLGINRINIYARLYGKTETEDFIKWFVEHPEIKAQQKSRTSYYSLYQKAVS